MQFKLKPRIITGIINSGKCHFPHRNYDSVIFTELKLNRFSGK